MNFFFRAKHFRTFSFRRNDSRVVFKWNNSCIYKIAHIYREIRCLMKKKLVWMCNEYQNTCNAFYCCYTVKCGWFICLKLFRFVELLWNFKKFIATICINERAVCRWQNHIFTWINHYSQIYIHCKRVYTFRNMFTPGFFL